MSRPTFTTLFLASAVILLAISSTVSFMRPLVVRCVRTQQDVTFLELDGVRFRLLHQWFATGNSPPPGLTADALTPLTITLRNAVGQVATQSRDPSYRDSKNRWLFDENAGNHIMSWGTRQGQSTDLRVKFFCVPVWFPLALALVPLLYPPAKRFLHRIPAGHCTQCGYDLTGNVSGACPECGAPVPNKREKR